MIAKEIHFGKVQIIKIIRKVDFAQNRYLYFKINFKNQKVEDLSLEKNETLKIETQIENSIKPDEIQNDEKSIEKDSICDASELLQLSLAINNLIG